MVEEMEEKAEKSAPALPEDLAFVAEMEEKAEKWALPLALPDDVPQEVVSEKLATPPKLAPFPMMAPSDIPEESVAEDKSVLPPAETMAEELLADLQRQTYALQADSRRTTKTFDAASKVSEEALHGQDHLAILEKIAVEVGDAACRQAVVSEDVRSFTDTSSKVQGDAFLAEVEALLGSVRGPEEVASTADFPASSSTSEVQQLSATQTTLRPTSSSSSSLSAAASRPQAPAATAAPGVLARAAQPPKAGGAAEGVLKDYSQYTADDLSSMKVSPDLRRRLAASTPALPGMSQAKAELETKRALRLVYHRVTSPPPVFRQYKQRTAMESDCEDLRPHDDPVLQVKRMQKRRAAYSSLPVSNGTNYQSWASGPCSSPRNHRRAAGGRKATSSRGGARGGSGGASAALPASPAADAVLAAEANPQGALAAAAERLRESQAALVAEEAAWRPATATLGQPPRTPQRLGPLRRTSGVPLRVPTCGAPGAALAAAAKRSSAMAAAGAFMAATPPGSAAAAAPRGQRPRPRQPPPSGCDMLKMLQGGALPSLLCPPI